MSRTMNNSLDAEPFTESVKHSPHFLIRQDAEFSFQFGRGNRLDLLQMERRLV
jgi:hypothetical protein